MTEGIVVLLVFLSAVLFLTFKIEKWIEKSGVKKLQKELASHPETLSLTKIGFKNERQGTNFNWPVYQIDGSEILVFHSWTNAPKYQDKLNPEVLKAEKLSLTKEELCASIIKKDQTYSYLKYGGFFQI